MRYSFLTPPGVQSAWKRSTASPAAVCGGPITETGSTSDPESAGAIPLVLAVEFPNSFYPWD